MEGIVIKVKTCRECPYLRYPWASATYKVWACGDSFKGDERPKDEKHWLGGDALPGDRLITDVDMVQPWCKHMSCASASASVRRMPHTTELSTEEVMLLIAGLLCRVSNGYTTGEDHAELLHSLKNHVGITW